MKNQNSNKEALILAIFVHTYNPDRLNFFLRNIGFKYVNGNTFKNDKMKFYSPVLTPTKEKTEICIIEAGPYKENFQELCIECNKIIVEVAKIHGTSYYKTAKLLTKLCV